MDRTALAAGLLEPVPVNRAHGIRVVGAADVVGEVELDLDPALANVIGTLHASGFVALLDAAGLAAVIAVLGEAAGRALPLGRAADVAFLAPGRGTLRCRCAVDEAGAAALRALAAGREPRARARTTGEITDAGGAVVGRGGFDWSVRLR